MTDSAGRASANLGIIVTASLAGLLFGFDTVVIAGATDSIRNLFHLDPGGFWAGFVVASGLVGTFLGALFAGKPGDAFGSRDALKVVGLAERAKHYPRQLSGGQEQRVGIARAIVTDPTLLLCDEPTGDLDRKAGDEILDLLQALNRDHGKTIVMVTHDPHAAERATRTIHLDKGTLDGTPA